MAQFMYWRQYYVSWMDFVNNFASRTFWPFYLQADSEEFDSSYLILFLLRTCHTIKQYDTGAVHLTIQRFFFLQLCKLIDYASSLERCSWISSRISGASLLVHVSVVLWCIPHCWMVGECLPQAAVVGLSGEAKTRPWTDRYPFAGWGILQGLRDWDLCSFFMAVIRSDESLMEGIKLLEFGDDEVGDEDPQHDLILVDDSPGKQFFFFLLFKNQEKWQMKYPSAVYVFPHSFQLLCVWWNMQTWQRVRRLTSRWAVIGL